MINLKYYVVPDQVVWHMTAERGDHIHFLGFFQNISGAKGRLIEDDELDGIFDLSGDEQIEKYLSLNPLETKDIIDGKNKKYQISQVSVYSDGSIGFGININGMFSSTLMLGIEFCPGFAIEIPATKTKYTIKVDRAYDNNRKIYYRTKIIKDVLGTKSRIIETCRKEGKEMLLITECE